MSARTSTASRSPRASSAANAARSARSAAGASVAGVISLAVYLDAPLPYVAAVALVSSGAEIAVRRGTWSPVERQTRRLSQAAMPLTALAVVIVLGVIELMTG